MYDYKTSSWMILDPLPTARSGLTASVLGGAIFVFGGESGLKTFEENEAYVPGEGWFSQQPMPISRHGLASVTVENNIYVIGGGLVPGFSFSGITEAYHNTVFENEIDTLEIKGIEVSKPEPSLAENILEKGTETAKDVLEKGTEIGQSAIEKLTETKQIVDQKNLETKEIVEQKGSEAIQEIGEIILDDDQTMYVGIGVIILIIIIAGIAIATRKKSEPEDL